MTSSSVRVFPVIMCGGSGTRLWPASRPARPKQFLPLAGQVSLFADTIGRLLPSALVERFVVVAGRAHAGPVLQDLARLGLDADLLLEPEARDSGPAIAAAAVWIAARCADGVAIVLASDHHVPDPAAFRASVETAADVAARQGRIVTLGVRPTRPSPAYGYIRPGPVLDGAVRDLAAFVEKPSVELARTYLDAGYLWNSGNFIARADVLMSELGRLAPDVLAGASAGVAQASAEGGAWLLGPGFRTARRQSFDFAVMERTDRAAVLPVDLAWSDLGAWDAVLDARATDAAGNSVRGEVVQQDCAGCLVDAAPGMVVALRGVSDLAVVAEPDAVLVVPLAQAQGVKEIVEDLRRRQAPQVDLPARGPVSLSAAACDLTGWLFGSALPAWLAFGFDHDGWGAVEQLDHDGRRDRAPRRARVQPRQAHAFAVSARLGWTGPAGLAAGRALEAMERHYRRGDGQVVALVDVTGTVLDPTTRLYDQAFVLLALASAGPVRPDAEASALALLDAVERVYAHPGGGFAETGDRFLSNPLMHLFEAALAWTQAGTSPRWAALAASLADLALTRLIEPGSGAIGEHYGADWSPLPGPDGAVLEPGHQFEWAWLLVRWARLGVADGALAAARRLYRAGLAGLDPTRGVMVDAMDRSGRLTARTARLWPQTEWLKAALILAEEADTAADRADLVASALKAAAAVRRYVPDGLRGLWHDVLEPDGQFRPGPSPASTLYHLVEAVGQLAATATRSAAAGWERSAA